MRTTSRPLATMLMLAGAMTLFAGCGDEGAHLPAGMSGSSASYTAGGTTGVDVIDDVLGGDPGPQTAGVSTMVDDPVLAGYDGVEGAGLDDPYSRAINDWSETEGSLGALDSSDLDDYGDDDLLPVGYGNGGYGGYGYGGNILGAAAYGGYGAGFQNAGMMDAGFEDPGLMDAGFEDPGFADPGLDAGTMDVGFDAGAGFDPGIDAGAGMDAGFVDPGFDAGAGMVDVGFDAGAGMDVGMEVGGGIEGMVF